ISLSSEILALAQDMRGDARPIKDFCDKAVGATKLIASGLGRLAGKAAVRVLTAGALSAADVSEELANSTATDAANLADKEISDLITGARKRRDVFESFRKALSDLPALLADKQDCSDDDAASSGATKRPLIFIVDDLDRCSPPYALRLLEVMKHFFSVPNIHFVLGVHLRQLEASVCAAYGSSLDARAYLQKFVHFTVPMVDTPRHLDEMSTRKYIAHLHGMLSSRAAQLDTAHLINDFLSDYAIHANLSLRAIERIYSIVAVCLATLPQGRLAIAPLLAGLAVLKVEQPDLYVVAKTGNLKYDQVQEFFGFSKRAGEESILGPDWAGSWWRFACDRNAPELVVNQFSSDLRRFGVLEREKLLPILVDRVLERFDPEAK
ncbi:MAG: hypothetical protein KDJ36_02860, partial [Hyphomicrobiaceae bacterium]|nr:hypothetical protein [Hyphomicrobiaceae bacterium]